MIIATSGVVVIIILPAQRQVTASRARYLLVQTHTVHSAWPCCLQLGKQVSRRHAPRARLRTGLDPAAHVMWLALYSKDHGGVSQIDVVSVPLPTKQAAGALTSELLLV